MSKPEGIKKVSESKHIRMTVYGDPGVGKTRLAGTSPGKVLIIRPPMDHTDSLLPADKRRVEEWVINDWNTMWEALDYLRHDGEEWDWVWLDSISLWQDSGLDDIWDTVIKEKPQRKRYGLDQGDYGVNMFRIGQWLRHVVGADLFNFGVTAHTAFIPSPDFDDDGDPVEKLMPWVQGKNMAAKLCGYMNLVSFYEINSNGDRILHTSGSDRFYAKDQFDLTESGRLKDVTMPKLLKLADAARGTSAAAAKPRKRVASRKRSTTTRKGR